MRHAKFCPRAWQFTTARVTRGHTDLSIALPHLRNRHLVRFSGPEGRGNLGCDALRHSRSSHILTHMLANPLLIGGSTRLQIHHIHSARKTSAAARDVSPGGLPRHRSLVVVESPAKAKKIQKYLGNDFTARLSALREASCVICCCCSLLPTHDLSCCSRQTFVTFCVRTSGQLCNRSLSEPCSYRSWRATVTCVTFCRSQDRSIRKKILN